MDHAFGLDTQDEGAIHMLAPVTDLAAGRPDRLLYSIDSGSRRQMVLWTASDSSATGPTTYSRAAGVEAHATLAPPTTQTGHGPRAASRS